MALERTQHLLDELLQIDRSDAYAVISGSYPKGGPSVAQVALAHEYGTSRVPPRPFIRHALATSGDAIRSVFREELATLIDGRRRASATMRRAAQGLAIALRESIATSPTWATPLSSKTIEKKRAHGASAPSHPLLDTGVLLNSIRWRVTVNGRVSQEGRS